MSRLRWQLALLKHRFGWAGILGVVALMSAVIYFIFELVPAEKLLIETRKDLRIAHARQKSAPVLASSALPDPQQQLRKFTGQFPSADSINTTWERISNLTDKAGLAIDRSLYQSSPEIHAGLLRYNLNMPVKAAYPQIRNFLAEIIRTTPNAVLEQVSFKRDNVDSPSVEANISLVLYVRAP